MLAFAASRVLELVAIACFASWMHRSFRLTLDLDAFSSFVRKLLEADDRERAIKLARAGGVAAGAQLAMHALTSRLPRFVQSPSDYRSSPADFESRARAALLDEARRQSRRFLPSLVIAAASTPFLGLVLVTDVALHARSGAPIIVIASLVTAVTTYRAQRRGLEDLAELLVPWMLPEGSPD